MRKLQEDIQCQAVWKRCYAKPIRLSVTYNTTGALYLDRYNRKRCIANDKTPIVLWDDEQSYCTVSVDKFIEMYVRENGLPINNKFIDKLLEGDILTVVAANSYNIWYMRANVETYGENYKYGVNSSCRYRNSGDYLICYGDLEPDTETVEVLHYTKFRKYYTEEKAYVRV